MTHLRPHRAARAACSGPVLGGWLTENLSWQWCFFINLPVAIALHHACCCSACRMSTPNLHELAQADWLGIVGLTVGLSSLTVVLEEGQREQWFQSNLIIWLAVTAVIGLIVGADVRSSPARSRCIKLRLLRNRTYASVIVIIIVHRHGALRHPVRPAAVPQRHRRLQRASNPAGCWRCPAFPAFMMMPLLPKIAAPRATSG